MLAFAFAMLLTLAPQQQGTTAYPSCTKFGIEGNIATGTGNCVLDYQDMHFEADWIIFDTSTGEIKAGDHVHFTRGAEQIDGSKLEMNSKTRSGTIWDATGQVEPGFHVKAQVAMRFEDASWEFRNTTITACESKEPCWTIVLGRANFRPGEWVRGKNTVFRFHDVPVFWLPFVVAPSERKERATGFLIPSISNSSSKGKGIREEFFYAINRSADASFVGEYFSSRGPTAEVTFRAAPNPTGWISVNGFFVKDRLRQGGHSLRILSYSNLGRYSKAVVDLETGSSVTFRQVWGDTFNVIASPINRSAAFLSTNKPNVSFNVLYSRSEFLHTDPSTALRKFPSLEMSIPSHRVFAGLPLYFRLDSSFSGLSRRDAVMATPTFGERFDFHPSLEMPILRLNALELSQEFGARETQYSHSLQPEVQRNTLNRITLEYASHFAGPEFEKSYGKWSHSIRPTLDYRYVTGADRFRQVSLIDEVDMVANTSEIEYGLTSRIMGAREILSWRVAQVAYFNPTFTGALQPGQRNVFNPLLGLTGIAFADGPRHVSPIVSTLRISPTAGNTVDIQVDYDSQLRRMRSVGIVTGLRKGKWGSSIIYAYTGSTALQASINQLHGSLSFSDGVSRGFNFSTNISYDVRQQLFQGATTQVGYNAECFGVNVEFSQFNIGARQDHKVRFALSLKNIGAFGNMSRPDRVF